MKTLVFVLALLISFEAHSQTPKDSISFNPKAFFSVAKINGKILTNSRLSKVMQSCKATKVPYLKYRRTNRIIIISELAVIVAGTLLLASNESTSSYKYVPLVSVLAVSIPIVFFIPGRHLKVLSRNIIQNVCRANATVRNDY